MKTQRTVDNIVPLVADLAPDERLRLIRLVLNLPLQDETAYA